MKTIIGVTFRHQGKVYYFDPNGETLERGDSVIVETQQGIEFAGVVLPNSEIDEEKITGELKKIVRIATPDDYDQLALNHKNEGDAMKICKEKIREHELEMKLIKAEYAFDRSKLTFFFTADGRVDFRNLVKDLASVFRTRIELRQVGVRDESRLIGGLGICGRPLCCATWLPDFAPVSIKMAKEQNLSLNSAKISGVCGRLMCCLKNEAETYEYLNSTLPHVGAVVKTRDNVHGKVTAVDVLRQRVTIVVNEDTDDKELRQYPVDELIFTKKHAKPVEEPVEEIPEELIQEEAENKPKENQHEKKKKNPNHNGNNGQKNNGHVKNENQNHDKKDHPHHGHSDKKHNSRPKNHKPEGNENKE